jgi:hypothetical protein
MVPSVLVGAVVADNDCNGGNVVKGRGEGGEGVGGDAFPARSCSMGLHLDPH